MALLSRKRLIAAKIESTYGTDSTPTGSNAIVVKNLNITPQDADLAKRDIIRPFLGNSEQLPAGIRAMVDFEFEIAGAGTAGTAPGYGPVLRSCGMSETLNAAAITGTAQGGAASTVTLAAGASAVDGFYVGMPINITTGTGSGSSGVIVGYNGTTKVATVAAPWAVAPAAASGYSIGACAVYRPVSSGFESSTIYLNVDGVLHKLTGARGTISLNLKNKEIPTFKATLTGIYNAVSDAAAFSPVYTAQTPMTVTNANTPVFALHGYAGVMSETSVDIANTIVHRSLVGGAESVMITNRETAGSITIEAGLIAAKDWFTTAKNATLGALVVSHGTASGNKAAISSSQVQLTKPTYQDMDGVQMLQMGMDFIPSTIGNDEFAITVY